MNEFKRRHGFKDANTGLNTSNVIIFYISSAMDIYLLLLEQLIRSIAEAATILSFSPQFL